MRRCFLFAGLLALGFMIIPQPSDARPASAGVTISSSALHVDATPDQPLIPGLLDRRSRIAAVLRAEPLFVGLGQSPYVRVPVASTLGHAYFVRPGGAPTAVQSD